jgi:hypothetical protein
VFARQTCTTCCCSISDSDDGSPNSKRVRSIDRTGIWRLNGPVPVRLPGCSAIEPTGRRSAPANEMRRSRSREATPRAGSSRCWGRIGAAMPNGVEVSITGSNVEDDRVVVEGDVHGVSAAGKAYDNRLIHALECLTARSMPLANTSTSSWSSCGSLGLRCRRRVGRSDVADR